MDCSVDLDTLLDTAVEVYRTVPEYATEYLSRRDAMVAVGITGDKADRDAIKGQFSRRLEGYRQRYGAPDQHDRSYAANLNRALFLHDRVIAHPTGEKLTQVYKMKLAGFQKEDVVAGKAFMRISRAIKAAAKTNSAAALLTPVTRTHQPTTASAAHPPTIRRLTVPPQINVGELHDDNQPTDDGVSPMSSLQTIAVTNGNQAANDEDIIWNHPPVLFPDEAGAPLSLWSSQGSTASNTTISSTPNVPWREAFSVTENINGGIYHLTNSVDHRRTSVAAHHERQRRAEALAIRKSIYKTGTVLYKSIVDKELPLKQFSSADHVAKALNDMVGIDVISSRDLREAIKNNNVNKSPPRLGSPGSLPIDEFSTLCHAVYTASALEQAGGGARTTREEFKSLVGEIVNTKRAASNLPLMNDSRLYGRVLNHLAIHINLNKADSREALRVKWLTYRTQKQHYENWEKNAVDQGFARELADDESPDNEGHIIWDPKQLQNILQFDEMAVSMDGKEGSRGGRPSSHQTATSDALPKDAGKVSEHTGTSMTLMMGINLAGEALPPLLIFPTKSKDPDNYKYKSEMAKHLPQLTGIYGFESRKHVNVPFAMNEKGGMNKELFHQYFSKVLFPIYPDARDSAGHRLMAKADSGPGRMNPSMLLADLRARGVSLYPGLPNGTEVGQECDQMFAYFKGLVYKNREDLYSARFRVEGDKASLSWNDIGLCVFGGTATLVDGSEIVLEKAFELAFTPQHIATARKACGYCPSTRSALQAPQIRHEVIEDEFGDIDEEADVYGLLLNELEQQNKDAVEKLIDEMDYQLAAGLRRSVQRVTAAQTVARAGTRTIPNSRARQDAIMAASTAGGFFHATNGGCPMTCDDALLAYSRKNMQGRAKEFEKRKKDNEAAIKLFADASLILTKDKWTKPDYQVMIKWKQLAAVGLGDGDYEDNISQNKPQLKKLWEEKYVMLPDPPAPSWTEADEAALEAMEQGEVTDFLVDTGIKQCQDTEDDYLVGRLLRGIGTERRKKVLAAVFDDIDPEEAIETYNHN